MWRGRLRNLFELLDSGVWACEEEAEHNARE